METDTVEEGAMPDDHQPETGTTDEQGVTPEPTPATGDDNAQDVEALVAALKEARNDAIKYRQRLRALEESDREREEAELSEVDRANKRAAELESELRERDALTQRLALESAVAMKASSLGIVDPEAAIALLDRELLDYDDNGKPLSASLDAALRRLLKAKPYLRTQPSPGSPANPAKSEPLGETPDQRRARLFGGNSGVFDPAMAARSGGGVISTKE